jgi:hypothetical protein
MALATSGSISPLSAVILVAMSHCSTHPARHKAATEAHPSVCAALSLCLSISTGLTKTAAKLLATGGGSWAGLCWCKVGAWYSSQALVYRTSCGRCSCSHSVPNHSTGLAATLLLIFSRMAVSTSHYVTPHGPVRNMPCSAPIARK